MNLVPELPSNTTDDTPLKEPKVYFAKRQSPLLPLGAQCRLETSRLPRPLSLSV